MAKKLPNFDKLYAEGARIGRECYTDSICTSSAAYLEHFWELINNPCPGQDKHQYLIELARILVIRERLRDKVVNLRRSIKAILDD